MSRSLFVVIVSSTWASYQIRKIAVCACAGNAGYVFPRRRFQRKPLVSDPGMHHDTCVTHVPWCMSGSLTRGGGENVPGIPGACATRNFMYLVRGPCYRSIFDRVVYWLLTRWICLCEYILTSARSTIIHSLYSQVKHNVFSLPNLFTL